MSKYINATKIWSVQTHHFLRNENERTIKVHRKINSTKVEWLYQKFWSDYIFPTTQEVDPLLVLVFCWCHDTNTGNKKVKLWFPTMRANAMRRDKKGGISSCPELIVGRQTIHWEHSGKNEGMAWACSLKFLTQVQTQSGNKRKKMSRGCNRTPRETPFWIRRNTTQDTRLSSQHVCRGERSGGVTAACWCFAFWVEVYKQFVGRKKWL